MEKKVNIAELLKGCPRGMALYSPIFGEVYLDKIKPHLSIVVITDKEQGDFKEEFLYDGRYGMNGECMLYPSKDKTTWEGFIQPFKDGDVVVAEDPGALQLFLLKRLTYNDDNDCYDGYCYFGWDFQDNELFEEGNWGFHRLATEEEKEKLFDVIKANGYYWDAETKTLTKLPEFKFEDEYLCELVPSKFDINTLKPFDKVLVRCGDAGFWNPQFFAKYNPNSKFPFTCTYNSWSQCIPYEGNEHLLDTTNDCDEYFKIW